MNEPECKCDPRTWTDTMPEICPDFIADDEGRCINCEHEKECHEQQH